MTNAAAIGYGLIALKRMRKNWPIDDKFESDFEYMMKSIMDVRTEEEAEEVYRNN